MSVQLNEISKKMNQTWCKTYYATISVSERQRKQLTTEFVVFENERLLCILKESGNVESHFILMDRLLTLYK